MKSGNSKFGVMSLRNRILVFALLITLLPFFGMGWLLQDMMQTTVTEKSEQKLKHLSNMIEREIALWFKERKYDLHIFSNSFVISDNYTSYLKTASDGFDLRGTMSIHLRAIETYLISVQQQFDNYTRLFILDNTGEVVVASRSGKMNQRLQLPDNLDEQIQKNKYIQSAVYFDEADIPHMVIGTPVYSEKYENHIGILAIEVRLTGVRELLRRSMFGFGWHTEVQGSLVSLRDGRCFLSSTNCAGQSGDRMINPGLLELFDGLLNLQDFIDHDGQRVVGILTPLEQAGWGLVVSEKYDSVFARVKQTRDRNLATIFILGIIIGLLAYLFAKQIITPLNALSRGAQRVAEGDLNVSLPTQSRDELGFATHVFNKMVEELRRNQEKLKQLATTDSLTGLANRKQIMKILLNRFEHHQRYKTDFSVLMIDVDHFKDINDTYGHLAGDTVLSGIGSIFLDNLRNVDSAGRYGGEEFLIILAESSEEEACNAAERIRLAVENHKFRKGKERMKVTVSIGAAKISTDDVNENRLVNRADQALYKAKSGGRNRSIFLNCRSEAEKAGKKKVVSIRRNAEKR